MSATPTLSTELPRQYRPVEAFDVDGFAAAIEAANADRWSDYFAVDAEWVSYGAGLSNGDPSVAYGNIAIHGHLAARCGEAAHLHVEDLVASDACVWFRLMGRLVDGRMRVEHVHATLADRAVTRVIAVESWDFA